MLDKFYVDEEFSINPSIPSSYGRAMSYYEEVCQLVTYVNQLYKQYVIEHGATLDLTNKYNDVILELITVQQQFKDFTDGVTIPDGSVTLAKLSKDCLDKISELVVDTVHNVAKFVWFGLDDEGNFIATIPESWNEIEFSTNTDGELVLQY